VLRSKDINDCKDCKDESSFLSLQSLQSWEGGGLALAYVLYTSGSTGRPKGVAVPHRAINRLILETDYIHLVPEDRSAHLSNTAFDASTLEVWGPLLTGGSLVIFPRELVLSPAALGAAFRRWRISVSFLTAALFNEVLREAPGSLGGVRNQLAGGEALSPRWVREGLSQLEPGCRLLNGYGPTECTTFAVVHDIHSAPEGKSIPIGRPIANTRAWVVDRGLGSSPVPLGVAGELLLGGDGLARGYWNRPDLTAERFVPDPFGAAGSRLYRTGDLVRWLADGTLEYLGRTDEQVKIRGFRIEPGEIESVLSRCPGVAECAVVARREAEGKILLAFATRSVEEAPDVRAWLRERLPDYMVPSRVSFLEALPRTSSGKVDRRALLSISGGEREEGERPYEPPRTSVEEAVAGIWAEVLGLERVGRGEGFFDLGGHSLLAGRVLARLRNAFGVDLPLRSFFLDPTVDALARRVERLVEETLPKEGRPAAPQASGLPPIRPVPRDGRLPLSFAQQRLWFFDRLAPASALYNMPTLLRIAGPLRTDALAAAVAEIVRRHESLRTVFGYEGDAEDEPVQRILPEIRGLAVIDLSGLPGPARRPEAERQERDETRRPFSLEAGPLFRSLLLRTAPDEHLLILNAHHIVSDGWSVGVLSRELEELYRAFAAGRPSPLPELRVGYPDFAVRQREWLEGGVVDEQLAWWTERLAGLPEGLDLPADRPRPAVQTWRGAVERVELPAGLSQDLLALGRRHGATPFMTLAAAFFALIHRHTGRDDLAVGFPTANRTRPEIEPLIGFFVNTLVLRADLAGEPGFVGALGRVRDAALGAWAHQDLPFERLVEALAPERDLSRSPLVQIFFAYQETVHLEPDLGPDLACSPREVDTGTSKFDLSLFLSRSGGGLLAEAEHATDLFEAGTIRRILERFEVLLGGIVAAPEAPLDDLLLLTASEREQVLVTWRGVEREYPSEAPVHRIFEEVAARQPGAPAVIWDTPDGERSLSYGELARDAARLASHLRSLGVGPGVPVALDLPRSPEMITAMIAVLQAGGFYVPLDPTDASERRSFILEDSGAAIVLGAKDIKDCKDSKDENPALSLESLQSLQSWAGGGLSLAYMIYTSGSTGRPKGVAVTHRAINRLVLETDYFRAGPGDRIVNLVNMTFDVSTWEVWGGLLLGAAVVVVARELVLEPPVLADWLVRMRADVCFLPVSVFNEVVRERPQAIGAIRELFSGGEALTPRWVREALAYVAPGHRLVNGYGPTECTCWALTHVVESLEEGRSVPIGRPIVNTTARILDRGLRPVPVGVPGELCLGGPGLAQGYWNRPDLTADRFVPDPFGVSGGGGERLYRTGDLSRWLPDGTVEYLGRTDHQVKVRGYRIEPGEIEAVLARCPGVAECAVVVAGESEGRRLAAFVAAAEGAPAPDVRGWLRERLPEYMVPAQVVLLSPLPKTSSGKIDRRALLALAASGEEPAAEPSHEAPRTPIEEIVAGAWEEVLDVDRVGLGASFFDLGGHSLLAGRVLARLRTAFGIDLPLRAFFLDPTVEGLASRVEEARRDGASPIDDPIVPVPRDHRIPLSFAQQRLWFFDRLEPGSALYNLPLVLRIDGPLRVAPLAAAVAEIAQRHESLRTVFGFEPGRDEPVQRILPQAPGLAVVDLSGLPGPARQSEAARQERDEIRRPFSLETGPLFRPLLLRKSPEENRLVLNAHHIVSDGWSLGVLTRELEALYRAFAMGRPSPLPELTVQVADFAAWQRDDRRAAILDEQLAWWKERLAGLPEGLDLPADRARPAVQSYRGAVERTGLPVAGSQALLRLGRRHGATPFMTLAAAFLVLLQRHTHRDDLAVGFPSANRNHPEIEPLIGFFVNTLVLRADVSGDFLDLLTRVREAVLGAWSHQDLPFERLVEALAPERDLSRSPLVQILFAYQEALAVAPDLGPDLSTSLEEVETGTAKFDLALFLREEPGGGLVAEVEHSTDLFDAETVRGFLRRLAVLVEGIVATPTVPMTELPLLTAAEREQVLEQWSGSETPYPRETPVHRVFEQVAASQPEAPAVLWDEGSLSYAELDRWSSAVAARLRGVPGMPVALEMERSPELIVAMLAVLKAGGFYVPLDPSDSSERRAWLHADSRAQLVLRSKDINDCKDFKDQSSFLSLQSLQSFMSWAGGGPALAYILYTSGSTGRPKGVAVPHRAINRLILETNYIHLGPEDRSAHLSNTAFDASTLEVWGPLLTGGALVIFPRELVLSPAALGAAFRRWKISVSFLTAALFNEVLREAPGSLGGVRNQLAGGEALSPRWVREGLSQLEPAEPRNRLLNGYGPTECTTFAVVHDIRSAPEGRSIPIGRPIANTRAYVLDRGMRPVPPGVAGELLLGGDGLAWGYWGRPDLTAERFVPDPTGASGSRLYRTGDLVRWLRDGTLDYLGRTDEQVKVRGFRIEPGEIESVLSRCPGIAECAVVARQEPEGKILLAFATRSGEAAPDVRVWLRERLPDYMVPSRLVFLDALPRTSSGKVDRRALLSLPADREEAAERPYQAPRTPVEEIVAGVWAEVLGVERVGLGEGFFDLGGHSLMASRTLARLRSALGIDLPLRDFFLDPTVDGVARRVEEARRNGVAIPPISPAPRDRRLPLSYAQERLWLVDQLQPGNTAYNSFLPLTFSGGPLDVRALEAALAEIVRRHEALRTRFVSGPAGPEQVVDAPGSWRLAQVDLSGLPVEARASERLRLVVDEAWRPFDLARGPLVRGTLVLLAPDEHALLLNFHHIVCDGWSLTEVLPTELGALYRAFREGRPSPLPELPVQYPDFAVWQREWLEGGALEEQLSWWQERLGGEPPVLDLPYDRPRPAALSSRGTVEMSTLSPGLGERIAALGRRHGATLFMTLLAAVQTLLQRYSHEDRIAIGTAVGNRSRHETEGLIGLFLNTLVLQTDLSGDPTFRGLLERVREVTLDAFDHQDLPFERLVAAVSTGGGHRDAGRSPLFQVLFLLQNMRVTPLDLPGLAAGLVDHPVERVQFDLAFTAYEWEGGLIFAVPYSTDLFDRPTIQRLLGHAHRLLEHVVEAPGRPLSEAPLLSEAERHQVLVEWPFVLLDPAGRPVPIGVAGEVFEDGEPSGRRARWRPYGSLEDVRPEVSTQAEPEALEIRLDRRQQQLTDRLDKLSPERRSLLRKWIRKG
jgi:amino acid adenylation domain-containing protein